MVFLDNASTTKPKFFRKDYEDCWFNSNMAYAHTEKKKLQEARDRIKKCLGVDGGYVLFFRNATEAIEWLSCYIPIEYCSNYEHDSVYNRIDFESFGTGTYAKQYVNQMTGHIFQLGKTDEQTLLISDFTAAIGHVQIPANLEKKCDAVFFSGHKFQTEKNIGCMWIGDRLADMIPHSQTTNNQFGFVHGTEDVAGALMLADAFEDANQNIENKEMTWKMLSEILLRDLNNAGIECHYVADDKPRTHAINALQFKNFNGDAIATWLVSNNIYVGVGHSACADSSDYRVLEAFGLAPEEASRVIRISFSEQNTIKDIKCLVESIIEFRDKFV